MTFSIRPFRSPLHTKQDAATTKQTLSCWAPDSVDALLLALKQKTLLSVGWPEQNIWLQTMVLGFDIYSGEILLSELCPNLPVQCIPEGQMYLQLPLKQGWIVMEANVQATIAAEEMMIVSARDAGFSENRRWQPRIAFPMRAGPLAHIKPRGMARQECFVSDLSRGGGLLHCLGKDMRGALRQGQYVPLTMIFNEHFVISTRAKILNAQFVRSPCCHTRLRLAFQDLEPEQRYQLDSYIVFHGESHCSQNPATLH